MGRSTGRVLATGALVAGLAWTGVGTAAAAPPPEHVTATTAGYATTVLGAGGTDTVLVYVTAPEGAAPVGELDVFVLGYYHCTSEDSLQVTIAPLESATATGSVPLTCEWDPDPESGAPEEGPLGNQVTGTASADLAFTGVGETTRIPLNGRLDHCVGRFLERAAAVSGSVTVSLGSGAYMTTVGDPSNSALRWERTVCPPGGL